jgi:hypothetical protein
MDQVLLVQTMLQMRRSKVLSITGQVVLTLCRHLRYASVMNSNPFSDEEREIKWADI